MATPEPKNKSAKMTRNKTAAIGSTGKSKRYDADYQAAAKKESASDRYKRERAAKEQVSYRGSGGGNTAADEKAKRKKRLEKLKSLTSQARSMRERRSKMASKLNPWAGK